jgi:hypoxanthine phosphoribosyltransferase
VLLATEATRGPAIDGQAAPTPLPHERVSFAHNSERQFAELLDFYGIEWAYEPTTFVLERNGQGHPVEAFRPDFYLPAYDLYIEITTQKQKLVTKNNRKVRRLQESHPEVQIKILYQRDYLNLLVKYGLESPDQLAGYGAVATAGETSGSLLELGIVDPPRR